MQYFLQQFINGLSVVGGDSTVTGLIVNGWELNGIRLATNGDNAVTGNFIGTDPSGTEAHGNQFAGVTVVFASSTNNVIADNVISGNGTGVSTAGPGNQATQIVRNLIGTDKAGTGAVPNANGVVISAGNNLIGDTGPGGNVISGNSGAGIVIDSTNAAGCRIFGNRIGTDVTGVLPLPNGHTGVAVSNTLDVRIAHFQRYPRNVVLALVRPECGQ